MPLVVDPKILVKTHTILGEILENYVKSHVFLLGPRNPEVELSLQAHFQTAVQTGDFKMRPRETAKGPSKQ